MKKVSLIMPAYNAASFIRRSVASVLGQSYGELELIVVDDGSKDETFAILSELAAADPRLRPVRVENGGPAMARNHGLAMVAEDSEYIMFLDSDDELLPDAVEYAMGGAEKGADISIFGFSIVSADGSKRDYCEPGAFINKEDFGREFARLYKANLLNQVWGKLYKTSLIQDGGIAFKDYRWGEDRLFIFDCMEKAASIALLPECKYLYIMQPGESLITRYYDKKFQVCLEADSRVEELCRAFGVEDESVFEYMFAKSIFSCLTNLFTPSCKLSGKEKLAFVKEVISNERVRRRTERPAGGFAVRALCAVMRTGIAPLNLFAFWAVAVSGKLAPKLFMKLKHRK